MADHHLMKSIWILGAPCIKHFDTFLQMKWTKAILDCALKFGWVRFIELSSVRWSVSILPSGQSEDIHRDLFSCLWLHIFMPLWFGFVSTDTPLFDSVIGYYIFFSVCSSCGVCADFSHALSPSLSLALSSFSLFLSALSESNSLSDHNRVVLVAIDEIPLRLKHCSLV